MKTKLFLAALSCLLLCACNSQIVPSAEDNSYSYSQQTISIKSISISMSDAQTTIYATQTKKIKVDIRPSVKESITWKFDEGANSCSISNNEIYVKNSAKDMSKIVFYASYNNVNSNKLTLTVVNIDERIADLQSQIVDLQSQRQIAQTNYNNAKSTYDYYMNLYYQLEEYCIRMGWLIDGHTFDPSKRDQWQNTKNQMDQYFYSAREAEGQMYKYKNEIASIDKQIQDIQKQIDDLRELKKRI